MGCASSSPEGDFEARPRVVDTVDAIGPVDVVFLAVKAHSLPALAPRLPALFGPETVVVSMQNGIPWWYFEGAGRLEKLDPGGVIAQAIEARRVIGSIVYLSTEIVEPGVIRHIEGNRITIGEPDGARTERCARNFRSHGPRRDCARQSRLTSARKSG